MRMRHILVCRLFDSTVVFHIISYTVRFSEKELLNTRCICLNINQLDALIFFKEFISCLYMFRAPCAHRQEVKIVL